MAWVWRVHLAVLTVACHRSPSGVRTRLAFFTRPVFVVLRGTNSVAPLLSLKKKKNGMAGRLYVCTLLLKKEGPNMQIGSSAIPGRPDE